MWVSAVSVSGRGGGGNGHAQQGLEKHEVEPRDPVDQRPPSGRIHGKPGRTDQPGQPGVRPDAVSGRVSLPPVLQGGVMRGPGQTADKANGSVRAGSQAPKGSSRSARWSAMIERRRFPPWRVQHQRGAHLNRADAPSFSRQMQRGLTRSKGSARAYQKDC